MLEGRELRRRRSVRPPPCPQGADGIRAGLRNLARERSAISTGPARLLDQAIVRAGPGRQGHLGAAWPCSPRWSRGSPGPRPPCREVGGTEGVGVTFLEETFSSSTAHPEHRLHQKAAQAVLKALLPETGTDIKGQMRSRQELLEASGYANRPRDFDDLIRILDTELRLITPTDPEGSSSDGQQTTPSGRYYQLTHDYLVHSLRDWLTRKQRETRRGRAELRLAERRRSGTPSPRTATCRPSWNGRTSGC